MSTADLVFELVRAMPEEQANVVLAFVEFLSQRSGKVYEENKKGWPTGFWDLYGSCADDPIVIDKEGISESLDDDLVGAFDS